MDQHLYCSAAHALCGEREAMVVAPPPVHDSAVLRCFHGFPPQAFPTTMSLLTCPQSISPQSTAALTLGLLHNPQTPAPNHCTFQGTQVPVWGLYGCSKDCLILILFRLPQISSFTLSLKCSSLTQTVAPVWELDPCFSSPTCRGQVQSS